MIYARLSYNTNNWQRPSGPSGKSRNHGVHEWDYRFGFEEWLRSKYLLLSDAEGKKYHYGYVEGIHKNYKVVDEHDILQLFTINCTNRQRFWVGKIKEWHRVSQGESNNITLQYPQLITSMRNDVVAATNNFPMALAKFDQHVNNLNGFQLFNIKYRELDYQFDANTHVSVANRVYKFYRFWFHRR